MSLLTRRTLLRSGTLATVPASAVLLDQRPTAAAPRLPRSPFTLGVASGDPQPDGVIIWTRLALKPLNEDGRGGMPNRNYRVRFQIATDPGFRRVVRDATRTATPEWGHSVRAVVSGLQPAREYWYRWRVDGYLSQVGRTLTAPLPGQAVSQLSVIQMSCSNWAPGYFNVYGHAANERPHLMVHLGDYIYEYGRSPNQFRPVPGGRLSTLADFRRRYALYRTDRDLRAAHAAAPWLVSFDDHEVENNYAGLDSSIDTANFAAYRARAYKAWFENQPVRPFAKPSGATVRMHRRVDWGSLARVHMLDTRQYRTGPTCESAFGDCDARTDPARSILGPEQTGWLGDGLATSDKRWDLLAQQVFFSRRHVDEPDRNGYFLDSWDGYAANRDHVAAMFGPSDSGPGPRNAVVLTGDTHAAWLADVKADFEDPLSATVAAEIGCTSISSSGDGYDTTGVPPFVDQNPHLRFHNALRGYCRLTIEASQLQVDYRVVNRVTDRTSPMWTRASYAVADRGTPDFVDAVPPAPTADRLERAPEDLARATLREELN